MLSFVFAMIGRVLAWLINAYITVLFVRMILDWVSILARNWYPRGVVAQAHQYRVFRHRAAVEMAASLYSSPAVGRH